MATPTGERTGRTMRTTSGRWSALARRTVPALATALFLAALAAPLAHPGRVLVVRDLAQFHLPLRTSFASLARLSRHADAGLPEWNPWIAGGQPLLSDPSYSAFYPPTWLALIVSPAYSLSLHALLHVALAFAGAYALTRRLGARPAVAWLGAAAYSGAGVFLSLVHALNHLPGAAWLPWSLLAADRLREAPDGRSARRPALALALVLALALLNGEPVTALCCALGAVAVALLGGARPTPRALGRVAAAAALAAALAAVQLAPALARLADSARAGGLAWERAAVWSLPPLRAVEALAIHVWGDPVRLDEGLYFGWGLHDKDYPFLISIYPSLAVAILALVGLASRGLPGRRAWWALVGAGVLLALGRHTPLYALLHQWVPPFGSVRYPEKFLLLAGAATAIAAALALERALAEREAGRAVGSRAATALAGVALALAVVAAGWITARPASVAGWAVAHSGLPANAGRLERAAEFYRRESRTTLGVAAATCAAFVALGALGAVGSRGGRRVGPRSVAAAFAVLVSLDLVRAHRGLLATTPASQDPPALARALIADLATTPGRIWSSVGFDERPELVLRGGEADFRDKRLHLERLDPWTGVTFGLGYALPVDYALTFTAPVRRALGASRELWRRQDRERFHRLLGAWSVRRTVVRKGPEELAAERAAGASSPAPAWLGPSPFALPLARAVAAAEAHPSAEAALEAALAAGLPLAEREWLTGAPWTGERRFEPEARARLTADHGATLRVAIDGAPRAPGALDALIVVAATWDPFWSAEADGARAPVLEAAAGYLAVPVPPGTRELVLRYRDPWVRVGGALSALALVAVALVGLRSRALARPAGAARDVQSPAA